MNKMRKMAVPILLAGTAMGAGSQAMADVPITRQSHDFLKIVDNKGVIQPSLSRMTSANVGIKSVAEKPVSPSLYRGGTPVSRPNCGIANQVWENVSIAQNAIEDCFDDDTYDEIQEDLAHLIEQTSARSGFYSYTEPVSIRTNVPDPDGIGLDVEERYFQVGIFLRANQSYSEARRIGINITPSDSAKNIYAIYEQPTSAPPIGYAMRMQGAGTLRVYTMDGLDPDSGLKLIHTEVTDEFAVNQRSAGEYTPDEQAIYDRSGVVKAIKYLAQYMDEYSSQLAILDYGNPISTKLKKDPMDPAGEDEDYTMPAIPDIKIETPERWYSRNECTMDNVTYGQRNVTNLAVEYKRDRYIINGDAEVARDAKIKTSTGSYTDSEGNTVTYSRNDAIQPESLISALEDIFDFEAFRGEDPVKLTTEHLNAYNYDYNKPISDFQNQITDPYNEYSTPPNNLFGIGQDDPFNNIDAEDYQDPANDVIDDSIVKVEYDVYKLVDEGYYTTRSKPSTKEVEDCETVTVEIKDAEGNITGTEDKENCTTNNITITETGEYKTTSSSWSYSNWVPPVYEKNTNTACIHNTQEGNFCDTYNCEQSAPEKDNDGYITDENISQYQEESFYWATGNWSGCEGACGVGTETRSVTCVSTLGGSSSQCTESKPISERPCQGSSDNCSFEWKTSDWSECSEVCDGGMKTRSVYCQAPSGERVNESRCLSGDKPRPNEQTICNSEVCRYDWSESNWSSCVSNASCASTGTSRGWLGNKMTTITGTKEEGFNGSHFRCSTSSTSNCSYGYSGRVTTTKIYGQRSRRVTCIRKNDGETVHIGFCGENQPFTHKECLRSSSTSGKCVRDSPSSR